jgi:aldose 1-epimerase
MTPGIDLLHLATGAWELEVQPARGGAVTALRHRGRAVLLSPRPASIDAMGAACFALVPYANRIAGGRIAQGGRNWVLPRNYDNDAHPLHGTGWKRPWSVLAQKADVIELALAHQPDAHWPWAFGARQRISLLADAVSFELEVSNAAAEPMPIGLGFHPAFVACASTTFTTQVDRVWHIDAEILPISIAPAGEVLPELPGPVPVARTRLVDHCFTGWSRELRIDQAGSDGDMTVTMTAPAGMDFFHLYIPPGKDFFCAEPVSHMPGAIQRPGEPGTGLRHLAPGEALRVWMRIAVRDAGA